MSKAADLLQVLREKVTSGLVARVRLTGRTADITEEAMVDTPRSHRVLIVRFVVATTKQHNHRQITESFVHQSPGSLKNLRLTALEQGLGYKVACKAFAKPTPNHFP